MINGKKIYFVSDAHLGAPNRKSSLEREKKLVDFLDSIKGDVSELYLLGDIFDFWFEYKHVIPRGYTRLLGKLADISDTGIPIHYFTGNHDMWMFGYLTEELNVKLYKEPITREINGKNFFIGHGDGLGPHDSGYKFIKKVFSNRFCQWLFARFHPNFGFWLANYFSRKSRIANGKTDEIFLGEDKEYLILYAKEILKKEHYDYFVFGHRHLPLEIKLADNTMYYNLGDWVSRFTYGVFDGEKFELKSFEAK